MTQPYDPLNYENLAKSVVGALLGSDERPLPPPDPMDGVGVYAIYYHGDFAPYKPLAQSKPDCPIYVGKATPAGARKGRGDVSVLGGRQLWNRLREHARNIEAARNLRLDDFGCRYLVVVPVWITLAERLLVEHFKPVWNVAIEGFGNHDPGVGRKGMKRPLWDILHPGRQWAERLDPGVGERQVLDRLRDFLSSNR